MRRLDVDERVTLFELIVASAHARSVRSTVTNLAASTHPRLAHKGDRSHLSQLAASLKLEGLVNCMLAALHSASNLTLEYAKESMQVGALSASVITIRF